MLTGDINLTLYHGSYCEVAVPDLSKCARHKDFGQGFYLTTSQKQAEDFARISLRKAIANAVTGEWQGCGVVSVFRCPASEWGRLSVCTFETADERWLRCVVAHRKGCAQVIEQYRGYGIIGGKIANDATNATLTAYMAGAYGAVGSEKAASLCISLLLPERLTDQYCFKSQRALEALHFTGSHRVWK